MENKTQIQLEKLLQALVKHDTQQIDDIYEHVQTIDLAKEIEDLEDNQLEYLCNHCLLYTSWHHYKWNC